MDDDLYKDIILNNVVTDPDYSIHLEVISYKGTPNQLGEFNIERNVNGFKIRWTLIKPQEN